MRKYTMLNGFKVEVELELYSEGDYNTEYSQAFHLSVNFSAKNFHDEAMDCYYLMADDFETFLDICDSIDGDMLNLCYNFKDYLGTAHHVLFNNNQFMTDPQFDGLCHLLLIDVIKSEIGNKHDAIISFMHKATWDEMKCLLEGAGYKKIENENLDDEIVQVILINEDKKM